MTFAGCILLAVIELTGVAGGDLRARAFFDANNVKVGDPLVLTVDFIGDADFRSLHPPALAMSVSSRDWKVDDASAKTDTYRDARRLTYRVRQMREGVLWFPGLEVSYRGTDGSERMVRSNEIPVHAKRGAEEVVEGKGEDLNEMPRQAELVTERRGSWRGRPLRLAQGLHKADCGRLQGVRLPRGASQRGALRHPRRRMVARAFGAARARVAHWPDAGGGAGHRRRARGQVREPGRGAAGLAPGAASAPQIRLGRTPRRCGNCACRAGCRLLAFRAHRPRARVRGASCRAARPGAVPRRGRLRANGSADPRDGGADAPDAHGLRRTGALREGGSGAGAGQRLGLGQQGPPDGRRVVRVHRFAGRARNGDALERARLAVGGVRDQGDRQGARAHGRQER